MLLLNPKVSHGPIWSVTSVLVHWSGNGSVWGAVTLCHNKWILLPCHPVPPDAPAVPPKSKGFKYGNSAPNSISKS